MEDQLVNEWNEEIINKLIMLRFKDYHELEEFFTKNLSQLDTPDKIFLIEGFIKNEINYIKRIRLSGRLVELHSMLEELISHLRKQKLKYLNELENNSKKYISKCSKGFRSRLTDDQIRILFEQLRGKYIDINTNPEHFKAIFRPDPLPPGFISIKRTKIFTGTLLAYFISELFQKENQSDYWHISVNCFNEAKNLKQSLRNAYEFNPDRKPEGYKQIDTILKSLYAHLQ